MAVTLPAIASDPPPYGDFDSGFINYGCHCPGFVPDPAVVPPTPIVLHDADDEELVSAIQACPGSIFKLKATGGLDIDLVIDGTIPPYPGYPDPVGCQLGSCPLFSNPSCPWEVPVCTQYVTNAYQPYTWVALGYVVDIEMDEDSPLRSECYFEVDHRLLSQGATSFGGIGAQRKEAQVVQELGSVNITSTWVWYKAPRQFTLTSARNSTSLLDAHDLPALAAEGSQYLRKDLNVHTDDMSLKNGKSDPTDVHVCVDYEISEPDIDPAVPIHLDFRGETNVSDFELLGYDVYSVVGIIGPLDTEPDPTRVGMEWNDMVFIVLPHSQNLMHEIGHACGLEHKVNPLLYEDNLMYELHAEHRRKVMGTQGIDLWAGNSRWNSNW